MGEANLYDLTSNFQTINQPLTSGTINHSSREERCNYEIQCNTEYKKILYDSASTI